MEQEYIHQNFSIMKLFGSKKNQLFMLKYKENQLIIQDPKKIEKLKYLNIKYCIFKWMGQAKNYFCFKIKMDKQKIKLDDMSIKFKKIVVGHKSEEISYKWFSLLEKLSINQQNDQDLNDKLSDIEKASQDFQQQQQQDDDNEDNLELQDNKSIDLTDKKAEIQSLTNYHESIDEEVNLSDIKVDYKQIIRMSIKPSHINQSNASSQNFKKLSSQESDLYNSQQLDQKIEIKAQLHEIQLEQSIINEDDQESQNDHKKQENINETSQEQKNTQEKDTIQDTVQEKDTIQKETLQEQKQDTIQDKLQAQNIDKSIPEYWQNNLGCKIYNECEFKYLDLIIKSIKAQNHFKDFLQQNINQIPQQQILTLQDIFQQKDFEKQQDNQLFYVNKQMMQQQATVLQQLLKTFARHLMMGQSIMSISLPVTVFEPQSLLERICEQFTFLPLIFDKIKVDSTVLEQIKIMTTFLLSSVLMSIGVTKPFNPIIGETKQAKIRDYEINIEQISHHPPISYFYTLNEKYKIWGPYKLNVEYQPNNVVISQDEKYTVELLQNKYFLVQPNVKLFNTVMGQRKMGILGNGYVFDVKNDIVSQIIFKKESEFQIHEKKDQINGNIYQLKKGLCQKYLKKLTKIKESDIEQKLSQISGNLCEKIYFDNQLFFDYQNQQSNRYIQTQTALPSDSIFRIDSIYLKAGDIDHSQQEKDEIENLERTFQKLRKSYKL